MDVCAWFGGWATRSTSIAKLEELVILLRARLPGYRVFRAPAGSLWGLHRPAKQSTPHSWRNRKIAAASSLQHRLPRQVAYSILLQHTSRHSTLEWYEVHTGVTGRWEGIRGGREEHEDGMGRAGGWAGRRDARNPIEFGIVEDEVVSIGLTRKMLFDHLQIRKIRKSENSKAETNNGGENNKLFVSSSDNEGTTGRIQPPHHTATHTDMARALRIIKSAREKHS